MQNTGLINLGTTSSLPHRLISKTWRTRWPGSKVEVESYHAWQQHVPYIKVMEVLSEKTVLHQHEVFGRINVIGFWTDNCCVELLAYGHMIHELRRFIPPWEVGLDSWDWLGVAENDGSWRTAIPGNRDHGVLGARRSHGIDISRPFDWRRRPDASLNAVEVIQFCAGPSTCDLSGDKIASALLLTWESEPWCVGTHHALCDRMRELGFEQQASQVQSQDFSEWWEFRRSCFDSPEPLSMWKSRLRECFGRFDRR